MGPLGELGALFNPGMRHEIEERKSKANRREEEGNARDGDLRIDLASGVAVINLGKNGEPAAAPAEDVAPQQEPNAAEQDSSGGDAGPGAATGPADSSSDSRPADGAVDTPADDAPVGSPLTAAQARRVAAAARRSAKGDRPGPSRDAAPGERAAAVVQGVARRSVNFRATGPGC